jgi:hypothetical protein
MVKSIYKQNYVTKFFVTTKNPTLANKGSTVRVDRDNATPR